METQIFIKILVGVKYENKDLAKEQGAKWDKENKLWYFKYLLDEFLEDDTKHTYQFKPYKIILSESFFVKYKDIATNQMITKYFDIAKERNTKYLVHLKEILNTMMY